MNDQKEKIIIGFDMDGVIVNNTQPKIRLAKALGFKLLPEQTPSEIISKHLPLLVLRELQRNLYDNIETALTTPLMRGARGVLTAVKKSGFPYFLISRRRIPHIAQGILKKHGLWPYFFDEDNAFFVLEPEDKDVKAAQLGVTHYIDDEVGVISKLNSVKCRFLFDQFNIFSHQPHYTKVTSWAEVKKRLFG
ncbi:MAG: hypothetical protein A2925_01250 [Candidatus Yanofskybacteria bacterium RIFCSPLOWO2_01_FULL_44_22]|uniref:Uncharacterized protein n=2 Tax=Candidatus Yanofskyibacteriota TaxID=1752733 RepID=A0A1F8GM70_9BACT|nr:MAG: hypothetical protein UW79_C0024G0017 [Candidatus Yanofskybacteria bacterium GW2011_GWA2_44_9]OGN04410.1 MAG: hypothetical protein A2659_03720 [Candidatus Yanofskybacteria bacterium RIFCSPHIGHO2_01_FULL_44_24]OGN25798.1 MAG: hypothetical protein A2925_01250 [Candidatus Yanofskybacteria bacterium RIFCSPLOWO2_01_FULL_44_22]